MNGLAYLSTGKTMLSRRTTNLLLAVGFSLGVKILLIPAYHSTDFEVHRNWFAVTHSLPINAWYRDVTSQWTLDYPPLFALFQWFLSPLATLFDEGLLTVQSEPYLSLNTKLFMRTTSILAGLLYPLGIWLCIESSDLKMQWRTPLILGIAMNAGVLLIDHIHFQYNEMLLGVLFLSIGSLRMSKGLSSTPWVLLGAFLFAALLMLKHLFLPMAPVYFVHLLFGYCLVAPVPNKNRNIIFLSITRFMLLGFCVLGVFIACFIPFVQSEMQRFPSLDWKSAAMNQLVVVGQRLFPFQSQDRTECVRDEVGELPNSCHERGLVHAYWAPNFWALYLFVDRALLALAKRFSFVYRLVVSVGLRIQSAASPTSGLVQKTTTSVLPDVSPIASASLSLIAIVPSLLSLAIHSGSPAMTSLVFEHALLHTSLSAFMFGWHVHEKAILIPLAISLLLSERNAFYARLFFQLQLFGVFSLFPLFQLPIESVIKVSLLVLTIALASHLLGREARLSLHSLDIIGIILVGLLAIFCEVLHPVLLKPSGKLEFLPLLLTSVLCSTGITVAWTRSTFHTLRLCLHRHPRIENYE